MKDENVWSLVFAGIAAITGVVYLYNQRNQSSAGPTYNQFPPLTTPQSAVSTGYDGDSATGANAGTVQGQPANPSQLLTPWPVYTV